MNGLILHNVSVGYRNRRVLEAVTTEIAPGSIVAVVGPNAAGKSTLMRAIAGLHPVSSGDILLNGEDLAKCSAPERARLAAYLPQSLPQATSLVAYEAVLSTNRAIHSRMPRTTIESAIERVFDQLGIRELAFRRLNEMSGGQRQMVGLAQAIVRQPTLLLLDEPTSALDLRWQLHVLEAIREVVVSNGTTCLMAMHDLNLAFRFADQAILLGSGRVLANGDPAEVMTADVLEAAYGVIGRIERCSLGFPLVLIDRVATTEIKP
jgi:iron complex transport system ATP-binding protein